MLHKVGDLKLGGRAGADTERGQAVVEFALVMVFFLVLLLAMLDLGRAYFTSVALENAAAEGALYGMGHPQCETSSDPGCADPNNIAYRIKHESQNPLIDPALIEFAVAPTKAERVPGAQLTITVTYPFKPIIPLLSAFGADTITLRRVAKQLIP